MNLCVNSFSNNKNNYSFGSLKENMRIGEKALKFFKKEYPYIKSSTFVAMRSNEHYKSKRYKKIVKKLMSLHDVYDFGVKINRDYLKRHIGEGSMCSLIKGALALRKYFNCGEQAVLVADNLKKMKDADIFCMDIISKDGKVESNHVFSVIDANCKTEQNNSKIFGNKAVVVDSWLNIVMPARDAIEYFKTQFCFDSKKQKISFQKLAPF